LAPQDFIRVICDTGHATELRVQSMSAIFDLQAASQPAISKFMLPVIAFCVCLVSCDTTAQNNADSDTPMSLIGTPLREPNWNATTKARLEKDLEIAEAVMAVAPEREDSYIWLGRRLGYLARYSDAIDIFTEGLERFPDSYKLLRFRGRHLARHREFDRAIADYRRAASLVERIQDSYEPDGIINARHQYLGSYRANIHYYLGQTSWAVGEYNDVLQGMERSSVEPLVQHSDRHVATTYWRYLAHRKLGQDDAARNLVADFPEDLDLLENHTYYEGVLFFKGALAERELLPRADSISKFAIAMEHHFNGEEDIAARMWREIVTDSAQGFWPAEAELMSSM
ncbi:MAG: tetratricopeptide repeat protein, partial [Woeseiaceae bacterium]